MSEKEYLLSKISQVAGQINRHKNQQENPAPPQPYAQPYPPRYSAYNYPPARGSPYATARGRGRGRGGRGGLVHRHRTLVLNSNANANGSTTPRAEGDDAGDRNSAINSAPTTPTIAGTPKITPSASPAPGATQQWVAKRDRHMQLINSAVYDQQATARAKAMEASRQERLQRRSERQKIKLKRYLQGSQHNSTTPYGTAYGGSPSVSNHEIVIGGSRYNVSAGGNKLVKVSDDVKTTTTTPKKAVVGGVTFIRSKSGNMWRSGLVNKTRGSTRKISKPCKYFTMTGKCQRGMSCPYTHDPNRVAICPRFLQSGNCPEGDACDLSHDATPHRVPACLHFLRGNCSSSNCRYAHIRVNPAAPICRSFATEGYCEKGGDCTERHVHECPDFDEKGVCNDSKCKLPHIERAGRRRMAAAAAAAASTTSPGTGKTSANNESPDRGEDSDVSSDEEEGEAFDSDDVDSDALSDDEEEEIIPSDGPQMDAPEVKQQLDFIRL
ncbi:hypothetical protein DFH27DRAFT_295568 [Peziza echinospora]|nr:hypothetical protein DFH27DRAFT_295568 [Peziza echinospora]